MRFATLAFLATAHAFTAQLDGGRARSSTTHATEQWMTPDRRSFLVAGAAVSLATLVPPPAANAIGPVRVDLQPTSYKAEPCPPSKPIPGEKAMKGMNKRCCLQVLPSHSLRSFSYSYSYYNHYSLLLL